MRLKRVYDPDSLIEWDEKYGHMRGVSRPPVLPKIASIEVQRATKFWNVSAGIVERGLQEGWLTLGDGRVTLKTEDHLDNVVYKILRVPGHYCAHCGEKIEDDGRGTQARAHLAERGHPAASPDPNNPSGWRRDEFYACQLESGTEAKPDPESVAEARTMFRRLRTFLGG